MLVPEGLDRECEKLVERLGEVVSHTRSGNMCEAYVRRGNDFVYVIVLGKVSPETVSDAAIRIIDSVTRSDETIVVAPQAPGCGNELLEVLRQLGATVLTARLAGGSLVLQQDGKIGEGSVTIPVSRLRNLVVRVVSRD